MSTEPGQLHQALVVAHGDAHHPHVHLMVNRVHPETLKAWDRLRAYDDMKRAEPAEGGPGDSLRAVGATGVAWKGGKIPRRSQTSLVTH